MIVWPACLCICAMDIDTCLHFVSFTVLHLQCLQTACTYQSILNPCNNFLQKWRWVYFQKRIFRIIAIMTINIQYLTITILEQAWFVLYSWSILSCFLVQISYWSVCFVKIYNELMNMWSVNKVLLTVSGIDSRVKYVTHTAEAKLLLSGLPDPVLVPKCVR